MKENSRNATERFWDRAAPSYDKEEQKHEKTYHLVIEKLKDYLQPTDFVLDFGCGTGVVAHEIAKTVKGIYAIDISSNMVLLGKTKAEELQLKNIQYTHATIDNDNLKAGTFDVVLALHILHLVEDTSITLQRIMELLKPGGLLISVTPCMANKPLFSSILSLLSRIGIVPDITSFTPKQLEQLLADENFAIVETGKLAGTSNQYFIVGKKIIKSISVVNSK